MVAVCLAKKAQGVPGLSDVIPDHQITQSSRIASFAMTEAPIGTNSYGQK